jgi:hypothetical protein
LVAGAVGSFKELPAPLGSFNELFNPPALAGPLGTPLTAAVPAPAEPALGDPAALPVPAVGPLAAPPAVPPPADPPPADPPPELPPPLCAKAASGDMSETTSSNVTGLKFFTAIPFLAFR